MAIHDGPVGMVLQRAARLWYAAECAADPKVPTNLTDGDIYALAIPRVRALFAGEVRWSETSPGDKALWRGRRRNVELVPQWLDSRWENLYDTVDLEPERCGHHFHDLFGIRNIGAVHRSNLRVPGQCEGALTFDIQQLYAEVSRDLSIHDHVVARLVIGNRPIVTCHLREAVLGIPIGQTVLERQNFEVRIDCPRLVDHLTVVMHLEGPVIRTVY